MSVEDLEKQFAPDLEKINRWIMKWIESTHFPPPKFSQGIRIDEIAEIIEMSIKVPELKLTDEQLSELQHHFPKKPVYENIRLAKGFLTAHRGDLLIQRRPDLGTDFIIQIRTGDPFKELNTPYKRIFAFLNLPVGLIYRLMPYIFKAIFTRSKDKAKIN